MINSLSKKLSKKLLLNGRIAEDEQELYDYGFFILISQLMYFILTSVAGFIFGCFFESLIFYLSFQFIRRYAGGYHASTEMRCELMSSLSIICSIGFIKLEMLYDFQTTLIVLAVISAICILFLAPLDTPEKSLSDKETKYFRKISWGILSIISVLAIISYLASFDLMLIPCCISLILEGMLIISGKIKILVKSHNEKV